MANLVGEFEDTGLSGQLTVSGSVGVDSSFSGLSILGVQVDLHDLGSVNLVADALSDDLGGVADILQHGVVDSSQSPGPGAALPLDSVVAALLGEDAALSDEDDMLATELLLEVGGKNVVETAVVVQEDVRDNN